MSIYGVGFLFETDYIMFIFQQKPFVIVYIYGYP